MNARCPACQKISRLPDHDAGFPVVCVACGAHFRAPELISATDFQSTAAEVAASVSDRLHRSVWWRVGAIALTVVAALGLVVGAVLTGKFLSDIHHPNPSVLAGHPRVATSNPATAPVPVSSRSARAATSRIATTQANGAASRPVFSQLLARFLAGSQPTDPIARPAGRPAISVASTRPSARLARRPPIAPVQAQSTQLTDERIGESIKRAVDYLLNQFDPHTSILRDITDDTNSQAMGADVLCVYALLQAGQAIDDPRLNPKEPQMKRLINAMKSLPLSTYHWETYARALRATALAIYDRPEDRQILSTDAAALIRGANQGGYTYSLRARGRSGFVTWDNSNSQYGLLGVWSAAETGREVPGAYWEAVRNHWQQTQASNGQWDYYRGATSGTHSMTCAGLASLFVAQDWLEPAHFDGNVGRAPFTPSIAGGLKWLESGDNCINLDHGPYDLYGLERVGLASGFKYFGAHDWYRELAASTIDLQAGDGHWEGGPVRPQPGMFGFGELSGIPRFRSSNGPVVDTAYNLLFLARGRHPILMNKLRFDGFWANRPRDLANLARFASRQLERPLNWQVVPLKKDWHVVSLETDWTDWMDSPVLYLASDQKVVFSAKEYDKIRNFVENGGLLFTQADGNSAAFNESAGQLAHKLFPAYEFADLPDNHVLYGTMFKVPPVPGLKYVSNGSRILMLHSTTDLSRYWEIRDDVNKPIPFRFGTNLFIYAAGKRDLRNRLVSTYIPKVPATPTATFTVARLSYAGNWDPEPAAWERFARWFQLQTGYGLELRTIPLRDLRPGAAPFAVLTGTARYDLTDDEAAAVKTYVDAGGVLLIDTAGGTGNFAQGLQSSLFFKVLSDRSSHLIPPTHPLLTASAAGMEDLTHPRLRLFAVDTLGSRADFPDELASGRGHILFTPLDLTTGLLGTQTWGILGYDPAYAQSLVKNAILWTWDGQKEE
jgi:hypothetical protein